MGDMRTSIRIFSRNFEFLGEVDDYEEFVFSRRLVTYGEFAISINSNKQNSQLLKVGRFVYLDGLRSGVIEHVEQTFEGGNGRGDKLLAKGFTLEYFFSLRLTYPQLNSDKWVLTGTGEALIKTLLNFNLLNTALNTDRRMNFMTIIKNQNRGSTITFETCYKKLDEEIAYIARATSLGVSAFFDVSLKKISLDVYQGRNLASTQSVYPPVIFSSQYDNIFSEYLIESLIGYKNIAVVKSKGEGLDVQVVEVGGRKTDIDRREVYVSAGDVLKTDTLKLNERGQLKLFEAKSVLTLDGKINPYHVLKYGVDYKIGDTVTLKYGDYVLHSTITEALEKWTAANGYQLELTFGEKMPTLIDKIKQSIGR